MLLLEAITPPTTAKRAATDPERPSRYPLPNPPRKGEGVPPGRTPSRPRQARLPLNPPLEGGSNPQGGFGEGSGADGCAHDAHPALPSTRPWGAGAQSDWTVDGLDDNPWKPTPQSPYTLRQASKPTENTLAHLWPRHKGREHQLVPSHPNRICSTVIDESRPPWGLTIILVMLA